MVVEKKEVKPEPLNIKLFLDLDEYIKFPQDVKDAIKDEKSTVTFRFEIDSRKQVDMQALLDGKPNQQTTHTELNIIGFDIVELPPKEIKEKPEGWMVKKLYEESKIKKWEPIKYEYKDIKYSPNEQKQPVETIIINGVEEPKKGFLGLWNKKDEGYKVKLEEEPQKPIYEDM